MNQIQKQQLDTKAKEEEKRLNAHFIQVEEYTRIKTSHQQIKIIKSEKEGKKELQSINR